MDKSLKELTANWIVKADNDLKTAKLLLDADESINDTIFIINKYLK